MQNIIFILLLPVVALSLVTAQSVWRSAVVDDKIFSGSLTAAIMNAATNPKMWLGALLYIATTILYLFLFSKLKFFVVQISVTGLALIFTAAISHFIFHEEITIMNLTGL
ncbi:hypothetical protein EXS66_02025, partial [Candidatus Saccharibacteria bacterium]|nr:hypothetical protein [Candidatus Saccharibacteria bacterium]